MTLPPQFLSTPIAHRALHDVEAGVPENSSAAVHRAMRAGYGIEIDVHLSSDGRVVVFHDDTLDRLTHATGPVKNRTARELSDLALKGSEERIPLLSDILDLVGGGVPLLVEIKDQSGTLGPWDDSLERAVAHELKDYDGPVAVMSFNPHVVAAMRGHAPDVARGLVTSAYIPSQWSQIPAETCARLRAIPDFDRVGAGFISHEWNDLGNPRVAELKAGGTPILCWTVRSAQVEAEARRVADNITFEGYLPQNPA